MNEIKESPTVWQRRWEALQFLIETFEKRTIASSSEDYRVLVAVLQALDNFGQKQFTFFKDRISAGYLAPLSTITDTAFVEHKLDYSVDDAIFETILNQISYDLQAFQRAQDQRIVGEMHGQAGILAALDKASTLAKNALQQIAEMIDYTAWPTVRNGVGDLKVITYLQKHPNVRIVPYAAAVVVGIPATAINVPADFLAIPHEIGHFLYWHGKTTVPGPFWRALRDQLEGNADVANFRHWQEEIFADVIALLIGGPVAAYTIQQLQLPIIGHFFTEDNGHHPHPAIRPYVYTALLTVLGEKLQLAEFTTLAQALALRWDQLLTQRHIGPNLTVAAVSGPFHSRFESRTRRTEVKVSLDETKAALVPMIHAVLSLLPPEWIQSRFTKDQAGNSPAWSTTVDLANPLFGLDGFINSVGSAAASQPLLTSNWSHLVHNKLEIESAELSGVVKAETWLKILRFAGWTSEGPGSPRVGG